MNRCTCYLIFSSYLIALGTASTKEHNDLTCFDHLVLPGYSMFARHSGPGTAVLRMRVGEGGSAERVDVDSGQLGLQAEVKSAMESVRFRPECAGDTIVLQMSFELVGPPVDVPFPRIVFEPPNRFAIISQPLTPKFYVNRPVPIKKQRAKEDRAPGTDETVPKL